MDQASALRQNQAARRVVKRSRWLLLRNRDNLSDEHTVKLDELLAANAPLSTVYVLKTQLKELWYASDTDTAHHLRQQWYDMALNSEITPLIQFAKKLRPYL